MSETSARADRIQDIEELIEFGATFSEVVERGGYKNWESLRVALRASGKLDLLERLKAKRMADGAPAGTRKHKPMCRKRDCGRKQYGRKYCKRHYAQVLTGVKQPNRTHCSLRGCGGKHKAKGYCNRHYLQVRKGKLEVA